MPNYKVKSIESYFSKEFNISSSTHLIIKFNKVNQVLVYRYIILKPFLKLLYYRVNSLLWIAYVINKGSYEVVVIVIESIKIMF